jgi:prepilin-type processing-associated H-X9-DG protein
MPNSNEQNPNGLFTKHWNATYRTMGSMPDGTSNTVVASEVVPTGVAREPLIHTRQGVALPSPLAGNSNLPIADTTTQANMITAIKQWETNCQAATTTGPIAHTALNWARPTMTYSLFNCLVPPNPNSPYCSANGTASAHDGSVNAPARSYHTGGVNAGFGDGSVQFISSTVDITAWQAAGNTNDGQSKTVF